MRRQIVNDDLAEISASKLRDKVAFSGGVLLTKQNDERDRGELHTACPI
jgi:hypothetical protein